MNQDNGGIIGKINTPTTSVASGVWTLQDQFEAQTSSICPLAFPQITIANACRFDDGSSDYLIRTPSGASNKDLWTFEFNSNNSKYLVDKGSVTINGVSLTVVNPNKNSFKVAVIDETYKRTNFQFLEADSQVNIEYDIISKYVERLIIDN